MQRTMSHVEEADVAATVENVLAHGPTRVIVNKDGQSVPPLRALNSHGIISDVIFVRDDGWSLGAPTDLLMVAHATWPEQWVAIVNVQTKGWRIYGADWPEELAR